MTAVHRARLQCVLLGILAALSLVSPASAQFKSPREEIEGLKEEVAELQDKVKKLEKASAAETKRGGANEKENLYSGGLLTLGGVRFRLGGKAEFLFIDSESERDPVVGSTENPDPHLEINRLRLEPELSFNREISIHAQIDFKPEEGRVLLKEMTARHAFDYEQWFGSQFRIGLDDRFIRPARRTKNYPLIGNAFWRDEFVGMTWRLRFGDKDGTATAGARASSNAGSPADADDDIVLADAEGQRVPGAAGSTAEQRSFRERKEAEEAGPFDFRRNWGEIRTYFSLGNGYTLNNNEVGFDGAGFNDLIQDDRNVGDASSLREIGAGLGYARSFGAIGEISVLGFVYNDELNSDSVEFLQEDLTVRDPVTGATLAGYGDSDSRTSYRYGVGGEYFLPATTFLPATLEPRRNDGLRLVGQWIDGKDGDFRRDGWYVQGSYRISVPGRLLFNRYIRSFEPLVRYGELNTDLSPTPLLPGTWDRKQWLLGLIVEVTAEVTLLVEYSFNDERTGGTGGAGGPSSVDNNELMLELLFAF